MVRFIIPTSQTKEQHKAIRSRITFYLYISDCEQDLHMDATNSYRKNSYGLLVIFLRTAIDKQ